MNSIDNSEIKDLISIDTFNDTSLFAVSVIDLSNYEVVYANQAMKNIMSDMTAQNCWESIHGQESPCLWCKAPALLAGLQDGLHPSQSTMNNDYITYENFNEVANKWYQLQEKVVVLKDSRNILISFALDISIQKEAQSKLIDTHVKLTKQTQALKEAQEKLEKLVNLDSLTNLYNRRYFSDISKNIISMGKRKEEPLSVIMIDIDKFKNINDNYGHSVGDQVIKLLADKLISNVRDSDIVARFGGEEFAIILPNTDIKNSLLIAEKIRKDVEECGLQQCNLESHDDSIKFTVSLGVDELKYDQDTQIDSALNRADKALYEAKRTGRNKVCSYS